MPVKANDYITSVKNIGPKKLQLYKKLGITTVRQLLTYLPRNYVDMTAISDLSRCTIGSVCLVKAVIVSKSKEQRIRKNLSLFKVTADSDGTRLIITYFNMKYSVANLKIGEEHLFYGEVNGSLLHREMTSPAVISKSELGHLSPVYPAMSGLSSRVISQDIKNALADLAENIVGIINDDLANELGLSSLDAAIRTVHCPDNITQASEAVNRIAFEDIFAYSTAMKLLKLRKNSGQAIKMSSFDIGELWSLLPFVPTGDQMACFEDIKKDLSSGNIMNRMIQGDVGSGKTLVAAAAAYLCYKNGYQTALMAPTELLARQHYETLNKFLSPLGVSIELMTGSLSSGTREKIASRLSNGEIDIITGTHALVYDGSNYKNLGLVITDEQHRFGVNQRAALSQKSNKTHTLVMSATPIPRTLSLILYGDLDVSLIKQLPPNRQEISTYYIDSQKRERAFGFIKQHIDEGRQAYIVCPLIDDTDEMSDLLPATRYAEDLQSNDFKAYRVGLIHGRMKPKDKTEIMADFISGEIQLLVSTTVIEVGVDVPNATIMLIENAERFGLSQPHQLRGRVGRGTFKSYCILISDSKGETTKQRLKVLCSTSDGFKIAEEDLKLRGQGEILGSRQHGASEIEHSSFLLNSQLLADAHNASLAVIADDPCLEKPQNYRLRDAVEALLNNVGTTPN